MVSPIAKYASICVVSAVAPRMSPPTPVEWSPLEEEPLACERGEERDHVDLALGAPLDELILGRDRRDESADVAPTLDRREVDRHVLPEVIRGHRVTRLVHRHRVTLALDVFVVVGEPVLLHVLRLDDVRPADPVASVADRDDERLVHDVLHVGAARVRRDGRQLRDLLVAESCFTLSK